MWEQLAQTARDEGWSHEEYLAAVLQRQVADRDDIVAAAMIDRLVHHAEVLTLSGDSYRTRSRRELLTTSPELGEQ